MLSETSAATRWQVWRGGPYGWQLALTTKRRWWARLWAWEHTKRGWFTYVTVREGEHPWNAA